MFAQQQDKSITAAAAVPPPRMMFGDLLLTVTASTVVLLLLLEAPITLSLLNSILLAIAAAVRIAESLKLSTSYRPDRPWP